MILKKISKFQTKNFDPDFLITENETIDRNFLEIKKNLENTKKVALNFLKIAQKFSTHSFKKLQKIFLPEFSGNREQKNSPMFFQKYELNFDSNFPETAI